MTESDILFEYGDFWVCAGKKGGYEVCEVGATHSTRRAIIGHKGAEGLERAQEWCRRLAEREATE